VAISDHAISFVEHENVNHRKALKQVWNAVFAHQLPQTTWCCDDDRGLVGEEPQLLLDGHATDKGADFDLVTVLAWHDGFEMVFDLDCELTSGAHDQALDFIDRLFSLVVQLL